MIFQTDNQHKIRKRCFKIHNKYPKARNLSTSKRAVYLNDLKEKLPTTNQTSQCESFEEGNFKAWGWVRVNR